MIPSAPDRNRQVSHETTSSLRRIARCRRDPRRCPCPASRGPARARGRSGHGLARHDRPELVRSVHRAAADHAFGILYAIHDALVKPLPNQKMGASLAESWTESADGLVYEFKLRRGLKFHNAIP